MKEYRVIFEGGLRVLVDATDVLEAAERAAISTSRLTSEIIEVTKVLHYFKGSQILQEDKTPGMSA